MVTSALDSNGGLPARRRMAIGLSARSVPDHIFIPRVGLQLPRQLPFDEWVGIGRQLSALDSLSAWGLGDWLAYGEEAYNGRYRNAIEQTSLDYQTLRNYAWVSRRFSISRRRETLSFGHHAEVASLSEPEQEFWLRKAESLSWSRNRLRQEVRASLRERSSISESDGSDGSSIEAGKREHDQDDPVLPQLPGAVHEIEIQLTPEQMESCRIAAGKLRTSVEDWAVQALNRAAQ